MRTEKLKVYICEHCIRKMFGAGAMSRHEKWCRSNPNNTHKCFEFCKYLKMTQESFGDKEGYKQRFTEMLCTKRNVKMYSYKFEKKTTKPKNALEGLERMPLECDLYEYMHADELPEIFK